jgi:hypothetical protein
MSLQEAYNTLGLARDASPEQVKKAYRKLALQFHPDKNPDPAATATFQQLSAAYKRVDDHLKRGASGSLEDFFGGAPFGEFDDEAFDLDDELGMPSMEEMLFMFDMLFGSSPPSAARRGGGRRRKGKKSGGVRVNLRRKGGKRPMPHEPPGFPSYVDQELMDMFARGMLFDGADAGLYALTSPLLAGALLLCLTLCCEGRSWTMSSCQWRACSLTQACASPRGSHLGAAKTTSRSLQRLKWRDLPTKLSLRHQKARPKIPVQSQQSAAKCSFMESTQGYVRSLSVNWSY